MGRPYPMIPRKVKPVRTKNRVIKTKIPVPESLPILKRLRKYEPISMSGQPLVVWDRAVGCHVYDKWGNKWLDWSSCVLVSNAGHGIAFSLSRRDATLSSTPRRGARAHVKRTKLKFRRSLICRITKIKMVILGIIGLSKKSNTWR